MDQEHTASTCKTKSCAERVKAAGFLTAERTGQGYRQRWQWQLTSSQVVLVVSLSRCPIRYSSAVRRMSASLSSASPVPLLAEDALSLAGVMNLRKMLRE